LSEQDFEAAWTRLVSGGMVRDTTVVPEVRSSTQQTIGITQMDVRSRGSWLVRSRGWIAILLLVPFGAATLLSWPVDWNDSLRESVFEALAWLVFLLGVAFRWWATLHVAGRKNETLISSGPYAMCRNPLYLGTCLMALAIALYMESVTFAGGLAVTSLFYLGVTVREEERRLRERFGETYVRYCEEVPRFLPRLRFPPSPPWLEVSVLGLKKELHRAARYMWIPLLAHSCAHLRMEQWWPHWWTLP
jgi:protein-S-isoprenylcysteine O-methyltransferase Ste14